MELETTIASIGEQIASAGIHAHEQTLRTMASAAKRFAPGAAEALTDPTLADALRHRAYSVVGAALTRNLDRGQSARLADSVNGLTPVSSAA